MKQDEIKKQLNEWKVVYSDDLVYQDLVKLYWEEKKKRDPNDSNSSNESSENKGGSPSNDTDKDKVKGVFYYLLKVRHYVSDNERWDAGLYRCKKRISRLEKSPLANVEIFEGEIPEVRIYEIAKHYLVDTTDAKTGKYLPAEEVLEELVTDKSVK